MAEPGSVDRPRVTGPFTTFLTTLARREQLTPRMVRLTMAGGDLVDFVDAGPDTFLYLLVPPPGCAELAIDRAFSWDDHPAIPEDRRPVGAYYTLAGHRREVAEVDIDVFLHDPSGHASRWAVTAQTGAPLALWGPRAQYSPMPGDDHLLLVGDETAVPAIRAILASLPPGRAVTACIEVADADDELPLPTLADAAITWLHRGDALARHSTRLVDQIAGLELPGQTYAWGGGESRSMTRVRRHLRDERGLDASCTDVLAYWRQGDDDE